MLVGKDQHPGVPRPVNLNLVVDDCFVLHAVERLSRYQ